MRKTAVFVALMVLVTSAVFAQDWKGKGRVMGWVYDEQGAPLKDVKVKCVSSKTQSGFEVVTDKEGKFVASWLRSGGWNFDLTKPGFAPKKLTANIRELGKGVDIKVTMTKIQGLVITEELSKDLLKGNLLFEEKKYMEAAAVFQGILDQFPDAYIINQNLGNCYAELGQNDKAEEYYLKILDKDPGSADALMLIGNGYNTKGDTAKALEYYLKVDISKVSDPIVLYNLGISFYSNGKFEEALNCFKKAVDIQDDFSDGLYQLGLAYLNLGKNADSITTFEKYLVVDPESDKAEQVKGFLDFLKKQPGS